jgi:hypothetical protein
MSDYNSSLPIRTETAGDVAVKVVDSLGVNQLKVESDGSINTNSTITGTDLDIRNLVFATDKVDVSGSEVSLDSATLAALENITVSATDLDIRDLAFATDKVDVTGSTVTLDSTSLAALENITATISGDINLSATTLAALENITVSATDLDIRDLAFATDKVDVTGSEVSLSSTTLAALENITVSASDLDIRNLVFATDKVDVSGSSISIVAAGTSVADFNTVASVASGASSTHTYTATGNFFLTQIEASGSGKMKIVVSVNGTPKFTQFSSTAETNMSIELQNPLPITSGQTIIVVRTNRDNQAQDVYSTICGYV